MKHRASPFCMQQCAQTHAFLPLVIVACDGVGCSSRRSMRSNAGPKRRPTIGMRASPGRWARIFCRRPRSMNWRCGRPIPSIQRTIDRELGWAESIGMNTMRVFLHNLLWEQDPKGFQQRIDTFLDHRVAPPHPAGVCALRFLLGSAPKAWAAASADSRRAQLRLGAGAGSGNSRRPSASIRASKATSKA